MGQNYGSITQTYATGAVSGELSVGGLVGDNNGMITQSYAIGAVSGFTDVPSQYVWLLYSRRSGARSAPGTRGRTFQLGET